MTLYSSAITYTRHPVMAWDARGRYSICRKVGGKVVREYFGSGASGMLMERLHQIQREERQEREAAIRRQLDEARADALAIASELADLDELADLVFRAAMLAADFHLTGRKWRHARRGRPKATTTST